MAPDNGVTVVVVPFPAEGHLNQFVHLSLLLSSHGLTVHYASTSTSTHIRQAKSRLQGWDSTSLQAIQFHHLPLPPFPTPPPDPNSAVKFPAQLEPLLDAFEHLRSPLASLLRFLPPPRCHPRLSRLLCCRGGRCPPQRRVVLVRARLGRVH